ncbi:GTPase-associated protein 1-related protein [Actinokineospora iranica]|uniref:Uncharacterized protein n=1 Tax=Actinokineospora iranica TaxID=1271860 RepID=A0A1G6QC41_9PSEU|nr:GTPase-associated protein 1-related protein [Actinokineospora iranica]SDC89474.1 hypothetical protein SAMN05216174_105185 [Actinokineospora iranica]
MTEPRFRSLYYTDCLPGQGLRGGAGFQFQAVSPGVGHETMTFVQRSSLYEAPVEWMRAQRPVADYPPSLTHVHDAAAGYVTARGVYLGAEANGVREGNQFTHALATGDARAYGQTRPAQLWDAPWWVERPAPGTVCDPVDAEPEPGPWGVDAIREWVLGRPDAEAWLTAVASAFDRLDGADRKRVLFVGADPAAVLGWIAAGTLLLPQERALRVGFRVYATNPNFSRQDVLAVHPDWAGALGDPARNREHVVFNLDTGVRSDVEPTPAARHWAPRFLRADPYDLLDAVELAHQFAGEHQPTAADRVVAGVVVLGDPVAPAETAALADWLAARPWVSTEDVADPVARMVVDAGPDLAGWRVLDAAMAAHADGALAEPVRLGLLRAELAEVRAGRDPVAGSPALTTRRAAGAVELIESEFAVVPGARVGAVLRLAARFGLVPRLDRVRDGVHRFAQWWADHPDAAVEPDRWPLRDALVDQLRDELALRLTDARAAGVESAVRRTWWRLLLPTATDPRMPLDAVVTAAAFAAGERGVVADVVGRARGLPQPEASDVAWKALFRHARPTAADLAKFFAGLPLGRIGETAATGVHQALADTVITAAELDLLAVLAGQGWEPRQPALRCLQHDDSVLRSWLAALPNLPKTPGAVLGELDPKVLEIRARTLAAALLDRLPPATAAAVLKSAKSGPQEALLDALMAAWGQPRSGPHAVALSYVCAMVATDRAAERFEVKAGPWIRAAGSDSLAVVEVDLTACGGDWVAQWRAYVAAARAIRRKHAKPAPKPAAEPKKPGRFFGRRGDRS